MQNKRYLGESETFWQFVVETNFILFICISACNCFFFQCRLMADLVRPLPSALTAFLSTLLPHGFAVGPSRLCEGRLGLWWVGRSLESGHLLGNEGDTEWASDYHIEPMIRSRDSELTMNFESSTGQTNNTEAEKVNGTF